MGSELSTLAADPSQLAELSQTMETLAANNHRRAQIREALAAADSNQREVPTLTTQPQPKAPAPLPPPPPALTAQTAPLVRPLPPPAPAVRRTSHPLQKKKNFRPPSEEEKTEEPPAKLLAVEEPEFMDPMTYGHKPKTVEPKQYVDSYTDVDVLRGRGGLVNHHVGNQWFLAQRDDMRDRYMAADRKQDKFVLSKELVERVTSRGGRFLAYDDKVQKWYLLSIRKARTKCSQALREERKPPKKIAQSLLKLKMLQTS